MAKARTLNLPTTLGKFDGSQVFIALTRLGSKAFGKHQFGRIRLPQLRDGWLNFRTISRFPFGCLATA